jgi:hypothetical protein
MANDKLAKTDDPKKDFAAILSATNKKNPKSEDIEDLRELMREDSNIWKIYGDWAKQSESTILSEYFESSGFLLETVKKKLANMRDELGWEDASEIEKLLIRQICLTWLRLYFVERQHHQATFGSHSLTSGIYWEKRLSMAQKRHLKAIESLAVMVKKKWSENSLFFLHF